MTPTLDSLDHLVLTVRDPAATVAFYTRALGMTVQTFQTADGSTRQALVFGRQKINLHDAAHPFRPHAADPRAGSADLCFLTSVPLDRWRAHFADLGIAVEEGPVRRTGATGPILSIYLRDPDGNLIEVSTPA